MQLNRFIDHTLLKATALPEDIITLCRDAIKYDFHAVCVNSGNVLLAKREVKDSGVMVASTVGFPLGAQSSAAKVKEAAQCITDGADEIDMVINIGLLKANCHRPILEEIREVKKTIGSKSLKVILETCYLNEEEIRTACKIAKEADADFVKTSTGFGTGGATEQAVKIMVDAVGKHLKIKASGGIKDYATAIKFIDLGVSRIGTSSGMEIIGGTGAKTSLY
ncbi:deoxyribose-phosphate aldolase [Aequorivita sp. SDUM287046]|uniref:Deoxyribose-phosphate aldolase n=1 Tax=Aequorivita aurantiaca TaxID=3053356 RepID=A0ABT8DMC4_9FLAO|nr:deoxyribose-phosphate aldolase [Aequorivita aurantiaca]MDN3724192.1 deoxyribose-phosphate aldolase [Aequorivita aurantiaca]